MSDVLDRLRAYREAQPMVPIEIPEWGVSAFIRPISVARHAKLRKDHGGSESRLAAHFIIQCLVDAEGAPVFADSIQTVAELERQSSRLILRVSQQILEGIGETDDPDAEKN